MFNGTVIHGTHRPEDLVPTFLNTAQDALLSWYRGEHDISEPIDDNVLAKINDGIAEIIIYTKHDPDYYSSTEVDWDIYWLTDVITFLAPDNVYFGTHPGDGSDFGFWPTSFLDEF